MNNLGHEYTVLEWYPRRMRLYRKNPQPTSMACYILVLLGASGALGVALFMQHGQGLQPCTLCIIQRYAFIWVSLCSLLALALPFRPVRLVLVITGIFGALGGIAAALRNLWVMAHPDVLCGRDPLELFLNGLPTAERFPEVFIASGLCSAPIPPLLGLSLPTWSLVGLLVLAALLGVGLRRR